MDGLMMFHKRIILLIPVLFFSISCNKANDADVEYLELADAEYIDIPATEQAALPMNFGLTEQYIKKQVKSGGIDFESEDVQLDYESIQKLLPKYGALIEHESQSNTSYRLNYELTIRVPADDYDTLMKRFQQLGKRLDNKYSNIADVTENYYDLKTRIKNKNALEVRYINLLEKASSIKDMLEIEKSLNQVRTDIERLEGQFKILSRNVSLSSIQLTFYEVLPYTYATSEGKGFGARVLTALNNGWQGLLTLLVGLTSLWPFILLFIVGVYFFRKLKWKRKGK